MTETEKMLKAFEDYYETTYNLMQRKAVLDAVGNPPKAYLLELYKCVTIAHPAQYGKLPDLAVVSKARAGMDRPEVYEIPPPLIEDKIEVVHESIREAVNARAKEDGELNHRERERVRMLSMKGRATPAELFWLKAIDEYDGNWRKAYRAESA